MASKISGESARRATRACRLASERQGPRSGTMITPASSRPSRNAAARWIISTTSKSLRAETWTSTPDADLRPVDDLALDPINVASRLLGPAARGFEPAVEHPTDCRAAVGVYGFFNSEIEASGDFFDLIDKRSEAEPFDPLLAPSYPTSSIIFGMWRY